VELTLLEEGSDEENPAFFRGTCNFTPISRSARRPEPPQHFSFNLLLFSYLMHVSARRETAPFGEEKIVETKAMILTVLAAFVPF
jgi:hypothetical protein